MKKRIGFFTIVFFLFFGYSFAEDSVTITTYYPSPYGVYREMRSKRMAIGDNYINNPTYTWEETDGDGGEVDYKADLVVEGNVGIGTTSPGSGQILHTYQPNSDLGVRFESRGGWMGLGHNDAGQYAAINYRTNGTDYWDTFVFKGGNVGIGTTSPGYKLEVAGGIRASEGTPIYSCPTECISYYQPIGPSFLSLESTCKCNSCWDSSTKSCTLVGRMVSP